MILTLYASLSQASPNALTYQGRIVKSDGTPLEYGNVSFLFEIASPNGSCIIFREQKDGLSMIGSAGVFDIPIGTGTKLFPIDPSFGLLDSFNNSQVLNCVGGSTYTPVAGDIRILKVQFHDGTGWKIISPNNEIRSIPYAAYSLSAEKLGTKLPSDFVLKTGVPNCMASGKILTADATGFSCVTDQGGTGVISSVSGSGPISVTGVSNVTVSATTGQTAGTLAAGDDPRFTNARAPSGAASGDLSGSYPNPTVAKIQNVSVSSATPSTAGQSLRFDGTQWTADNLAISDVSNLNTALSGKIAQSQFPASCLASQTLTFMSPSGAFTCSTISINASQVTGNIAGTAAGFTGALVGDVSGTQSATSVDKLKGKTIGDLSTLADNQILSWNATSNEWRPVNPAATVIGAFVNGGNNFGAAANLGTTDNFGINLRTNNTTRLAVTNTGDIGIGTDTPSEKLDVIGKIKGTELCIGNDCRSDWPTAGGGGGGSGDGWVNVPLTDTANFDVNCFYQFATADGFIVQASVVRPTSVQGNFNNMDANSTSMFLSISSTTKSVVAYHQDNWSNNLISANKTTTVLKKNCGNNGTVSSVSSANSYISIADTTSTPEITLNVGTTAGTVAAGNDARFTDTRAPTGPASGDLSGTYPSPAVDKIRGNAVASGIISGADVGKVYRWNGTNLTPAFLTFGDLRTSSGAPQLAAACAANEKIQWSVITDAFICQTIGSLDASAITTGTISAARLPANTTRWQDGASGALFYSSGNVGIGTTTPSESLEVIGKIKASELCIGTDCKAAWPTAGGSTSESTFHVTKSSTQALSPGVPAILDWQTKILDTEGYFNLSTERFQPTISGKYLVQFSVGTSTNMPDTGNIQGEILKNGVVIAAHWTHASRSDDKITTAVSAIVEFNGTTDYIAFQARTGSSSQEISSVSFVTFAQGFKIGGGSGGGGNPAGTIITFAGATCPLGYLAADGSAQSRATQSALFAAINTLYGAGDGSTTFNLPDLRGEFVRGWDNGRGVDSGRSLGSTQSDDLKAHTHSLSNPRQAQGGVVGGFSNTPAAAPGGGTIASTDSSGGAETRPRNIALLYCIKL